MAFNINSSINMKSINKVSSVANNVAFKDKFYDDVEKGTYAEIDYSDAAGIDIQEGIEAANKAREDRIKREQEEARRKAEEARLKLEQERQAKIDKLNDLYKQRDDNNGLFHPKKEAQIEAEILKMEKELGVKHKPDGWESFCDTCEDVAATAASYTVTAVGSVAEGFVDLGEGVVDSLIYGAGELGIVDKDWAYDVIAYDVSAEMYEGIVNVTGIDKDIAYGTVHTVGNVGGKALGYLALSSVPYVGTALCMQAGAGSSVEKNLQEQMANNPNGEINDWEVRMSAGLGALEGWGAGKAATAAKTGFNTIKGIGWNGAKEAGKSTLNKFGKDVIVNTIKDNGKTMVKNAAISTFTEAEFYTETAAMVADDIKTGIKTGEWDILGMAGEVTFAYGSNFVGNLGGEYFEMADVARTKGVRADKASTFVGEEKFVKYNETYMNPEYYDIDKMEEIWPPGEGSRQYSNLSDEDMLRITQNDGIDGLKELGATEVTFDDLKSNGGISRATAKGDISQDIYGEYFGGYSTTGNNDVPHRVLGPNTTEAIANGSGNLYKMNIDSPVNSITIMDADGFPTGLKVGPGTDYDVRILKTETADWFGQTGGAEQYVFYVTDKNGQILTKNAYNGTQQSYKLTRSQLEEMGIITNFEK